MANSTASLSVLLQVFDGLSSNTSPLVNHQMPTVQYGGSSQNTLTQNTYGGYLTIGPGGAVGIAANPPVTPFLVVRNAGAQGIAELSLVSAAAPTQQGVFNISPGGIWIHANPNFDLPNKNYILAASVSCIGQVPVTIEYLIGV
jgi:hypothetical protein